MSTAEPTATKYDAKFYKDFRDLSFSSAKEVVPLILELMPLRSVCDVGCGDDTWLRAFREAGVTDVLGIDGEYVTKDLLQIPVANFRAMELHREISLQRSFLWSLSRLRSTYRRIALQALSGISRCAIFSDPKIWKNKRIAHWYRQNALLFSDRGLLDKIPELALSPHSLRFPLVHPEQMSFPEALRAAVSAAPGYAKDHLKRFLKW